MPVVVNLSGHQLRDAVVGTLPELQAMGIRLAIDDFGTGYSSLAHIQRLPADALKIDTSFIDEVDAGGQGEALVAAIIDLARTFGLTTVAEGIERPSQAAALRRLGCDFGQGHHLGRPRTRTRCSLCSPPGPRPRGRRRRRSRDGRPSARHPP